MNIKRYFLLYFLSCILATVFAETNLYGDVGVTKELPIVFVISSYNNAKWVEKNLNSVFMQNYHNFRVIYIDDGSEDGTAKLVEEYIHAHSLQDKIVLIKNSNRAGKMKNIYNAYHLCKDNELIAQLDGDDWLPHPHVLLLLNKIFSNPDVWFSYGQFQHSTGKIGFCCDISLADKQNAAFRKLKFVTSHLKVFYAWLFKMVKLQDLMVEGVPGWEGQYYPYANDCAMVYPMLDMARERVKFNNEVIYIFNRDNPISGHTSQTFLQRSCAEEIKALPPYPKLHAPKINRLQDVKTSTADCLILSDNPFSLRATLRSLKNFMHDVSRIIVWYECKNQTDKAFYQTLKEQFNTVNFYDALAATTHDVVQDLANSFSNYVVCMCDNIVLKSHMYCKKWIMELEKTFSHACYGLLTCSDFKEYNIPHQHIHDDIYAWKFLCDKEERINPNNFALSLYRKKDVIAAYADRACQTLEEVALVWASTQINKHNVGLFFDRA